MSRRKNTELNLHANDDSVIGRVLGAKTAKTQLKSQDIKTVRSISSDTTTINLIAHSGEETFSSKTNVSSRSAQELAAELAKKYGTDKSKLTDFNLISCEAGLSKDGTSFAQQLANALYAEGFTNVRVHAMTPPKLAIPAYSMIVETSVVAENLLISSWCYRSHYDEQRDIQITKRLNKLENTEATGNDGKEKDASRKAIKQEKDLLKQEQSQLRLYVCVNTPYAEALSKSQNTIAPSQAKSSVEQKEMHEYVAFAISFLNSQKTIENAIKIQGTIQRMQKHPEINSVDDIIKKCQSNYYPLSHNPNLPYELQNSLRLALNQYIADTNKRESRVRSQQTFAQGAAEIAEDAKGVLYMIQSFFQRLLFICGYEDSAPAEFKSSVLETERALAAYKEDNNKDNKTELQSSLDNLKTYLTTEIEKYLAANPNPETEQQQDKNFLMQQFKDYLTASKTKEKQQAKKNIERILTPGENSPTENAHRLWNKGIASRVAAMKKEYDKFIELEKKKEEAETPTQKPRPNVF